MILATLLLAAASTPAVKPPEQAAGAALMQCVAHTTGAGSVSSANRETLAANGLVFLDAPPPMLRSTMQTELGTASYAASPSTEGSVWAVGYDGGACLVFAIGMSVSPVEARLVELFSIPNSFVEVLAAPAAVGERKREWKWLQGQGKELRALVSLREVAPGKGFTMVTINRVASAK